MTRHPKELLAAYVDGELDAAEHRRVRAHLRSCARCRGEIEAATRVRDALASLPEVEPPSGTAFRILRQAPRPPATGRAWRIATAVGVAASLVAGVIVLTQRVNLGDLGGGGQAQTAAERGVDRADDADNGRDGAQAPGAAEAGAEAAELTSFAPIYRASNARYTLEDMPEVLERLSRDANDLLRREVQFTSAPERADADEVGGRASAAVECSSSAIRAATPVDEPGIPFAFERAVFQSEVAGEFMPGYVAAYLQVPAEGGRPTRLFMTVVDRETCDRLLYYAQPVDL